MNVLVQGPHPARCWASPRCCANGSTIAARCWCGAPSYRLAEIEHRLEVLGGYLIAYLNLDKVIKIIRKEDEPKPVLMKTFKLTDVQAEAILNMRLRNLRKLEEMEIRARGQGAARGAHEAQGADRLDRASNGRPSPARSRKSGTKFGPKTALGKRRTDLRRCAGARRSRDRRGDGGARADHGRGVGERLDPRAARPRQRSVRRARSRADDASEIRVPDRDHSQGPDLRQQRPLLHARCLEAARRARPRRAGAAVSSISSRMRTSSRPWPFQGGRKFLVASHGGNGFVVPEDEVLGTTRKGKQVLNLKAPDKAAALTPSTANWWRASATTAKW